MSEITTDERGRITIPKAVRDRFGEQCRLVELENGIKLMPVPDNPLESLRNAASDELKAASMEELREAGLGEGRKQATEHVR